MMTEHLSAFHFCRYLLHLEIQSLHSNVPEFQEEACKNIISREKHSPKEINSIVDVICCGLLFYAEKSTSRND